MAYPCRDEFVSLFATRLARLIVLLERAEWVGEVGLAAILDRQVWACVDDLALLGATDVARMVMRQ